MKKINLKNILKKTFKTKSKKTKTIKVKKKTSKKINKKIAVYDLGGGTFDISILELEY